MEVILEKETKSCNVAQTEMISRQVELMIIIGAKNSTSSNELYAKARQECNNAIIVETMEDLYLNYIKRFKKVGVMVTSGVPKNTIDEIVSKLRDTETQDYMYKNSRI